LCKSSKLCTIANAATDYIHSEPKGKTFAEMDILFENKVSARKFASTAADPFRGEHVQARNGSIVRVDSSGEQVEKQTVRHNEKY